MSFRPSFVALSKASRIPLTSKGGNKEYYKGTGSFPGLGPKRAGRHGTRSKGPYILEAAKMRTFVVPEGLDSCGMQPYVARFVKPSTPASWPIADTKSEKERKSKRQGLFGPGGFDGAYYLQLAELAEKTKTA